jgi:hypothetical protein
VAGHLGFTRPFPFGFFAFVSRFFAFVSRFFAGGVWALQAKKPPP